MNTAPAAAADPGGSSVRSTFRSYATVVGVSGMASVVSFVTTVLLARHLTTADFGLFSLLFAAMTVLWTATSFGDTAYVRFVNASSEETDEAYLRAVLVIEGAALLLLAALSWPAASALATALGDRAYFTPLVVGILLGLGMNLVSLWGAVFQAEGKFFRFSLLRALVNVIVLVLVGVTIVFASLTLQRVYAAYGLAVGVMVALSLTALYRRCRPLKADGALVRTIVRFSRWLMAANVVYVVSQRLDVMVVAAFTSRATVGQYGAALRIAVVASLLTGSIAPLMLPKAARLEQTRESLRQFLRHVAKFTSVLVGIIALIWLSLPLWVPVVFGERYEESVSIARILLFGSGCLAAYTPLSQLFVADDRPRRMFVLNVVRLSVLAILLAVLTPRFGASGGAWGIVGAEVVALAYTVAAVARQLGRRSEGDGV